METADSQMDLGRRLVEALTEPDVYSHDTGVIELVETHCAWVLLTGAFAYKLKKPVDFGFLDFSTLEKRRFYCEEEVRLNRRFAARIYLDVVAVTGQWDCPRMGGDGPVIEYAVRMRQFPAGGLLSQLAEEKRLEIAHIDQLVEQVAGFHQTTACAAGDSPYGDAEHIHHWVSENFQHIRPSLQTDPELAQLDRLRQWADSEYERLGNLLRRRKRDGFIRECHGDLHLGNITLIDGKVTLFDCIEFNSELRWIDVISEVAFLIMDLDDRGYRNYAFHFLNAYLQQTADYEGLRLLSYYLVYRALVRAKVAMLRRQQARPDSISFFNASAEYSQYMQLAEGYLVPGEPLLLITHGLSGSGKSTLAGQLAEAGGMIRLRSDVERKRMAGLAAVEQSGSGTGSGLYSSDQTENTYRRLAELAGLVLRAGYPVIVDATFLQSRYRGLFRQLAQEHRMPFVILDCRAPAAELERRIQARGAAGGDASEATLDVLTLQRNTRELLDAEEARHTVRADTSLLDLADVQARIEVLIGQRVAPAGS